MCNSSQYPRISHTPYPIHRFTWVSLQSQECRKELGVLPYCCSLYTWEPRDPRMLPWYSCMIGPKERWSKVMWSWSLNSPAGSIIKGHFMRSGWFSWHQYCWAGELVPPKMIVRITGQYHFQTVPCHSWIRDDRGERFYEPWFWLQELSLTEGTKSQALRRLRASFSSLSCGLNSKSLPGL